MDKHKHKIIKRGIRHNRVRAKIFGDKNRPRLSVYRSLSGIYAQLIDDEAGKTLVQASLKDVSKSAAKAKKSDVAKEVGKKLAEKAMAAKITLCVFDRGGFAYHGRVKALAEGAREGGLKF